MDLGEHLEDIRAVAAPVRDYARSVVGVLTVVPGRAKPLNGGVHLVLLAAYLFLSVQP